MARLARTTMLLFCTFLAGSAFATTYYVDYSSGSDSNNGTSKTTPWKNAPGMQTCKATCSSTTIRPGDSIILRGGVTWPNASFMWNLPVGASGNPVYIGVDQSWYAGGAWARPILNAGGVAISNNYDTMFNVNGWVTFDNFEIKGFFWNNAACSGAPYGDCGFFNVGQHDGGVFENLYVHGWTHAGTDGSTSNGVVDIFAGNGGAHSSVHDSAFDGTEVTGDHSVNVFFGGPPTAYNNWIQQVSSAFIVSNYGVGAATYYNNHIEDIGPAYCNMPVQQYAGSCTHENAFEDNGDVGLYFYNNTINNVSLGLALWIAPNPGYSAYLWNNVVFGVHDNQIIDVAASIYDSGLCVGGSKTSQGYCSVAGSFVFYNNTIQCGDDTTQYGNKCSYNGGESNQQSAAYINNHFIADVTTGGCGSGYPNCTYTNNVVLTQAQATAQGYSSTEVPYAFAPPGPDGTTVTASSTNLTTIANGNSALLSLLQDTTYDVGYDTANHTVVVTARFTNARPSSGSWQVGAYYYDAATPTPPSNLTATVK